MGASTWNYVGNNCDIFSGWCYVSNEQFFISKEWINKCQWWWAAATAATERPAAAAAALAKSSTAWDLETRALHPVCLLQVMLRNRLSHHHAKSMYLACPRFQNDWNGGGVSHVHKLDITEAVKSTTLWPCLFASLFVGVWWRVHIWNNGPKQKFMSVRFMSHLSKGNWTIV